jgi:hypothetical protein
MSPAAPASASPHRFGVPHQCLRSRSFTFVIVDFAVARPCLRLCTIKGRWLGNWRLVCLERDRCRPGLHLPVDSRSQSRCPPSPRQSDSLKGIPSNDRSNRHMLPLWSAPRRPDRRKPPVSPLCGPRSRRRPSSPQEAECGAPRRCDTNNAEGGEGQVRKTCLTCVSAHALRLMVSTLTIQMGLLATRRYDTCSPLCRAVEWAPFQPVERVNPLAACIRIVVRPGLPAMTVKLQETKDMPACDFRPEPAQRVATRERRIHTGVTAKDSL